MNGSKAHALTELYQIWQKELKRRNGPGKTSYLEAILIEKAFPQLTTHNEERIEDRIAVEEVLPAYLAFF